MKTVAYAEKLARSALSRGAPSTTRPPLRCGPDRAIHLSTQALFRLRVCSPCIRRHAHPAGRNSIAGLRPFSGQELLEVRSGIGQNGFRRVDAGFQQLLAGHIGLCVVNGINGNETALLEIPDRSRPFTGAGAQKGLVVAEVEASDLELNVVLIRPEPRFRIIGRIAAGDDFRLRLRPDRRRSGPIRGECGRRSRAIRRNRPRRRLRDRRYGRANQR